MRVIMENEKYSLVEMNMNISDIYETSACMGKANLRYEIKDVDSGTKYYMTRARGEKLLKLINRGQFEPQFIRGERLSFLVEFHLYGTKELRLP